MGKIKKQPWLDLRLRPQSTSFEVIQYTVTSTNITTLFIYVYECLHPCGCFETAADFVYISESNENWEKYSIQR